MLETVGRSNDRGGTAAQHVQSGIRGPPFRESQGRIPSASASGLSLERILETVLLSLIPAAAPRTGRWAQQRSLSCRGCKTCWRSTCLSRQRDASRTKCRPRGTREPLRDAFEWASMATLLSGTVVPRCSGPRPSCAELTRHQEGRSASVGVHAERLGGSTGRPDLAERRGTDHRA